MIIEVAGGLFAVFALSRVFLRFREGRVSWGMMAFWTVVWFGVITFLIHPTGFEPVSRAIGIQRPLDLMLIGGLLLAYYLNFRVYVQLDDLRSDLAEVVRDSALGKRR